MQSKILAFDVETTGLDSRTDDIVQLSALMIINGEVIATFNQRACPKKENAAKILENPKHPLYGISEAMLMDQQVEFSLYHEFVNKFLIRHIDKFDTTDKAYPLAYNGHFDLDFLSALFTRNQDNYLGSFINWKLLDPRSLLNLLDYRGALALRNYKLSTVAEHFGVTIQAHDALSDIHATWAIWNITNFLVSQPSDYAQLEPFRKFWGVTETTPSKE